MNYTTIISAQELGDMLGTDDLFVFDCRFMLKDPQGGQKMYHEGHIAGAQFADMDTDLSSAMTETSGRHPLPNPDELITKLRAWGVNNSSQVVVYDDMFGAFAARMWWLLRWLGHDKVAVLNGGLKQWSEAGQEMVSEVPQYASGDFSGSPKQDWVVDIEFVQSALADQSITLFDARSADRYTGADQKTDPVPGHVPGAMSMPFMGNLTKEGCFLDSQSLKARFENKLENRDSANVVNMCGSGVTACHNLLAMEIAGLGNRPLYVGSWSEWIRSGDRPVATGNEA